MRVPFLSRGSAAVAQAQVRLALRTPRGRSIMLSPFVVFVLFAIVIYRQGQMELGFANLTNGLNLATFGGAVCLLAILPFALNQFAIDGSGLTMALLSPLSTRELLAGKAVGNGLIAVGTAAAWSCSSRSSSFPSGSPCAVAEPAAGARRHLRARRAGSGRALGDLSSRRRPQQHRPRQQRARLRRSPGTAPLRGCPACRAVLIVFVTGLLHRPELTPIVMLRGAESPCSSAVSLFSGVAVLFDKRRENLGIVVSSGSGSRFRVQGSGFRVRFSAATW